MSAGPRVVRFGGWRTTGGAAAPAAERAPVVVAAARRRGVFPARRAGVLAAALAALVALFAAAPAVAGAACPNRLAAKVELPDGPYAAAYTKHVRVAADVGRGNVWNFRAELYTFSGQRLAVSRVRRVASGTATLTLELARAFRPMQPGGFTLVLKGDPGGKCGEKQATRVLRFRACRDTLPITFGALPGGTAADYGGWLSIPVSSGGGVIRDVTSSVASFEGALLGRAPKLSALFGDRVLDHKLQRPLSAGRYTVVVEGLIAEQPAACGRKRAQATLTFR